MERRQALRLLRAGPRGVDRWNSARAAGAAAPSLREADLAGAFLEAADLSGLDLAGADLSGAALPSARLAGAQLAGADLECADLYLCDLTGANLRRARLVGAQLTRSRLRGADLRHALLGDTLIDCDLSGAKHLSEAVHTGASDVSYEALLCFEGRMPERFLRGCEVARCLLRFARLERAGAE